MIRRFKRVALLQLGQIFTAGPVSPLEKLLALMSTAAAALNYIPILIYPGRYTYSGNELSRQSAVVLLSLGSRVLKSVILGIFRPLSNENQVFCSSSSVMCIRESLGVKGFLKIESEPTESSLPTVSYCFDKPLTFAPGIYKSAFYYTPYRFFYLFTRTDTPFGYQLRLSPSRTAIIYLPTHPQQ